MSMPRVRAIGSFLLIALAIAAQTQQYAGPVPAKSDLPYLKHAGNLVETEPVEFKEGNTNGDVVYTVAGESSPAKTPLALPVFLFRSDKIAPEHLEMYRLDAKDGHREISQTGKRNAPVIHVVVRRLAAGLFRLDVSDDLESGQYVLSLDGTDRGFCFQIE
jgi:hypothetical protein